VFEKKVYLFPEFFHVENQTRRHGRPVQRLCAVGLDTRQNVNALLV
jgi:hypothetical protein